MSAPTQQLISPAKAESILQGNTKNRNVSKAVIARYAAAMQRGDWMLSNDVICITTDGILLNGQHRMNAVVVSETSQDFWVWEGCPPDAQMVMDMGNKRDAADNATLSGGVNISRYVAKAMRFVKGDLAARSVPTATPQELIEWHHEWGDNIDLAIETLPTGHRTHALYIAAVAEALNWKIDCADLCADFFGIMLDNQKVSEEPIDSANRDYIPACYFKWVNALAKDRKRITTWGQYKLILNGLQAYIDDAQWSKKKSFTIDEAPMSPVLFRRPAYLQASEV